MNLLTRKFRDLFLAYQSYTAEGSPRLKGRGGGTNSMECLDEGVPQAMLKFGIKKLITKIKGKIKRIMLH